MRSAALAAESPSGTCCAEQPGRQLAGACRHQQATALHELDHEQARVHQRAPALGDELEDHIEVCLRADGSRDLGGGVERGHGPLQLVAVLLVPV